VENALAVFRKGPLPSSLARRRVEPPAYSATNGCLWGDRSRSKGSPSSTGIRRALSEFINFDGKAQRVLLTSGNIRAPLAQDTTRQFASDVVSVPNDLLAIAALALVVVDELVAVLVTRRMEVAYQCHAVPFLGPRVGRSRGRYQRPVTRNLQGPRAEGRFGNYRIRPFVRTLPANAVAGHQASTTVANSAGPSADRCSGSKGGRRRPVRALRLDFEQGWRRPHRVPREMLFSSPT
jgi:hypothetical protein